MEGGVYVSDWTQTFEKTGKGRIYHVYDPVTDQSPIVRETKRLLALSATGFPAEKLSELLGHPDRRIRAEAQFELAERAENAMAEDREGFAAGPAYLIAGLVKNSTNRLVRLHALWAFGQICRALPALAARMDASPSFQNKRSEVEYLRKLNVTLPAELRPLQRDENAEIRAQYAKFLGDCPSEPVELLFGMLRDPNPRVQFFVAQSLGELGRKAAVPAAARVAPVEQRPRPVHPPRGNAGPGASA